MSSSKLGMARLSAQPDRAGSSTSSPNLRHLTLVGLVTMLVVQAMRVLFPLLYHFREHSPLLTTALFALAVFLAPVLAAPLVRLVGERAALPVAVGGLVAGRLALQLVHPIPLWLAVGATAVGLIAMTEVIVGLRARAPRGTRELVLGVFAGLAVDAAIRASFLTWDVAWQDGAVPLAITAVLLAATTLSAWPVTGLPIRPIGEGRFHEILPIALIGPFLMLQVLFLQSIPFAASSGRLSLEGGTVVVLVGYALGLGVAAWVHGRSLPRVAIGTFGVALAVGAYGLHTITGNAAVVTLLVAQILVAAGFALALDTPPPATNQTGWRTGTVMALGGLGLVIFLLAYQTHYQTPLPVSNAFVPALAALLFGLVVMRKRPLSAPERTPGWMVLPLVPLLLLVPLGLLLARPDRSVVAGNGQSVRVLSYNVHSGVNTAGQVDPESTARTIEAQRPDVVLLQEVGRGWPISGTLDLAEWMSRRLDMPFLYQPAADEQFGNAILSRLPILSSRGAFLPLGPGSQRRSYFMAKVDVGAGRSLLVTDAHLQNTKGTSIRAIQIQRVIQGWNGAPNTVIAGDLNAQPDQPDVRLFARAGLSSAQDAAGLGSRSTASHPNFAGDRVDWMFTTSDLRATEFAVPWSDASDHLPLAATIWVG